MSNVTTAILTFQFLSGDNIVGPGHKESEEVEQDAVDQINASLGHPYFKITECDAWGGFKSPQVRVALGVFNHFDTDKITQSIMSVDWPKGHCVQMMINEEEDIGFKLIEFHIGEVRTA